MVLGAVCGGGEACRVLGASLEGRPPTCATTVDVEFGKVRGTLQPPPLHPLAPPRPLPPLLSQHPNEEYQRLLIDW